MSTSQPTIAASFAPSNLESILPSILPTPAPRSLTSTPLATPLTLAASTSDATPRFAGLTSAEDIANRQRRANLRIALAARRSSLAGLTLRVALDDVKEVLVGVPRDLFESRQPASLSSLFLKNDRLRGTGLLLLLFATVHAMFL